MSESLLAVYNRPDNVFDRGEGVWLHGTDGVTYLDCVSGIATNALGHAHPALVDALTAQAKRVWHLSNMFRVPGQEVLAEKLVENSFADAVFVANSGSEAIEGALKAARRYHSQNDAPERIDIFGFEGSFHGRTYAAINASGNPTYLDGFGPRLPGFEQLAFGDHAALEAAIKRSTTAAIIVEPVQGEGGARALPGDCLQALRRQCTEHGVLLIYDEVQSGMGRTGKLFAHQWFDDAAPDIMAIAKALGGGFPVGAFLVTASVAGTMKFGTHGSTFGGNPLAMAVANTAFDLISDDQLLAHVTDVSNMLRQALVDLAGRFPDIILDVRGKGLLIGVKLVPNNREFMVLARSQALLIAGGGDNCVRLLPPLNITKTEAIEALTRFERTCLSARTSLLQAA